MPWLIQHKCDPTDAEPSEYAILRGERDGMALTRVQCPKKDCREEFFIIGHEMFEGAESNSDRVGSRHPDLPPGFVIASRRTG